MRRIWHLGVLQFYASLMYAKLFLQTTMMAVVMPALGWGPFVHPHINRRALEDAQKRANGGDTQINQTTLDLLQKHRDLFIFAANSADAISNHNVIHGLPIYDYAHNYLPDSNVNGEPRFGYALVDTWKKNRQQFPEEDGVIAYGWLAHQLADWYPHYAHIKQDGTLNPTENAPANESTSFSGYADSHPVFGNDYLRPVLDEQRLINHALIELFWDIMILDSDNVDRYLDNNRVELFPKRDGKSLITECAKLFGNDYCVIPAEHVGPLRDDFNFVIDGMRILIELMKKARPGLPKLLANSGPATIGYGRDFIERSVNKVVEGVFCVDDSTIGSIVQSLAKPKAADAVTAGLDIDVHQTPKTIGSVFFRLALQLGMTKFAAELKPVLVDEPRKILGMRIPRRLDPRVRLISEMVKAGGKRLMTGTSANDPLVNFLSKLLIDSSATLNDAVGAWQLVAKPAVALGDPKDHRKPELIAKEMLLHNRLNIRICPASRLSDNATKKDEKAIKDSSLLLRLNGYPLAELAQAGAAVLTSNHLNNDPLAELLVECKLNNPLAAGVHHLFVDAQDKSEVWAYNKDLLIEVK